MSESGATKNQLNFIRKLRDGSEERENAFQEFLKEKGKSDVSELSVPEASEAIDAMKKISVKGDTSAEGYATGKQINFLSKLQDTEERQSETRKYLEGLRKGSINHLSIKEASELIDKLIKMGGSDNSRNFETNATRKQIKFIQSLQKSERQLEVAKVYLKELKKESFDELSMKEASELINKLKE